MFSDTIIAHCSKKSRGEMKRGTARGPSPTRKIAGNQAPTTSVIPRSEATWESPGISCEFEGSSRRLPRPCGARNDGGFRSLLHRINSVKITSASAGAVPPPYSLIAAKSREELLPPGWGYGFKLHRCNEPGGTQWRDDHRPGGCALPAAARRKSLCPIQYAERKLATSRAGPMA